MSGIPSRESSSLSSAPTDVTHHHLVLSIEGRLREYHRENNNDNTVAILSAFMEFLPTSGARNIADDILQCQSDQKLRQLADHLHTAILAPIGSTLFEPIESFSGECEKNLIGSEEVLPPEHTKGQDKIGQDSKLVRPIVRSRGPTPNVILSPRFNAEDDVEEIASEFDGICSRSDQRRLKLACLARDDARCVVTGFYDDVQVMSLSMADRARLPIAETHVAHILPYSLGSSVSNQSDRIWDALYRYFPRIRAILTFTPSNINDTSNALTMWPPLHSMFGDFRFAFESTSVENTYRIKTYPNFNSVLLRDLPSNRIVTFTAHNGLHSLPSPLLLEVHASIAQIFHATGMGQIIEDVLRERDSIRSLANNGSTNIERLLLAF